MSERVCRFADERPAFAPECSGMVRWREDFGSAPSAYFCDGHREFRLSVNPGRDPFVRVRSYVVRESSPGWFRVYDEITRSEPALAGGRFIYSGEDRARAQRDADWLNSLND